jgi:nitrogen fixation protein FixH
MTLDPPHRSWQPLLTVVIVLFLALTGWSIFQAQRQVSSVTDRNYYSHGLKYNETALERRAAQTLGWQLTLQLNGRTLELRLTDETGRPISGGSGNLLLDSRPGGGRRADLPLQEREPGFYRVALPDRVQGPVQGQVTLTSAGASIHRSLLLSL